MKLKKINIYYLTVSEGQELGSGLAGWFRLQYRSQMLAWAAFMWSLDWGWRITSRWFTHTPGKIVLGWQVGSWGSLACGPFHYWEPSLQMVTTLPYRITLTIKWDHSSEASWSYRCLMQYLFDYCVFNWWSWSLDISF